jgi:choline dehydrogenase-like flavoprotein
LFYNNRASLDADFPSFEDKYYYGRNPTHSIIANYRNLHKQDTDYVGGFTTFAGTYRLKQDERSTTETIGAGFKEAMSGLGGWRVYMYLQGETIPKQENHVRLSTDQKDQWGIPLLVASVGYDDNDDRLVKDFLTQSAEMMEKAGCKNINSRDNHQARGLDIHEMGGCRMGKDPKTSLLNEWNQMHHCKNVFVTDGACMTSTGNQSPSILYMALTARAANHAVEELKKGGIFLVEG